MIEHDTSSVPKGWSLRRVCAVLAVVVTGVALTQGVAAANPGNYPVPWSIIDGFATQVQSPGVAPAGSNDWNCMPSVAHPRPVVLAHGGFVNRTVSWQTLSPFLANQGYCVYSLDFGKPAWQIPDSWKPGAMNNIQENAVEIGAFVQAVLNSTGADKVDIVAQSFGSLSTNHWMKYLDGAAEVDRFVAISPLWHGTDVAGIDALAGHLDSVGAGDAWRGALTSVGCAICEQFLRGSTYLTQLNNDGFLAPGVNYTNIISRLDWLLTPPTTGFVSGATNIDIQDGCSQDFTEHLSIGASRRTAGFVLRALDPGDDSPVPCDFRTPLGG